MRGRGQLVAAVLLVIAAVAAGVGLQRGLGVRALAGAPAPLAPSGAWFCPHGGGTDWQASLQIANPGGNPVRVRVTPMSDARPGDPRAFTVEPGREVVVPEATSSRASSSMVEYFGGWVAAAWVSHAAAGEKGAAAEPCAPSAGSTWLLPDGSTELAQEATSAKEQRTLDSWVVVMNPFATDAVFSVSLYADKDAPVYPGAWTNVVLKPFRSRAFLLNDQRQGFATVSATVEAKVGRVVASSLDVNEVGGIRASLGQPAPAPSNAVLPGGFDLGQTDLVVMNPTDSQIDVEGTVLGRSDPAPIVGPDADRVDAAAAQTFPVPTEGPSTLDVRVPSGAALVRRTYGRASDQAATGPGVPARAWVVAPAIAGRPSHPGLVLTNPGGEPVHVSLSYLMPSGVPSGLMPSATSPPEPITLDVPGLRTVAAPSEFVEAAPHAAILATSSDGTFVPAAASYSLGQEGYATYAVALGVPIPDAWVPSAP